MRRWCECGRHASHKGICARCAELDGERLAPVARAILSELRAAGRARWDALRERLGYEQRQLHRGMAALLGAGRVVRRMVMVVGKDDYLAFGLHPVTHALNEVSEFELAERG